MSLIKTREHAPYRLTGNYHLKYPCLGQERYPDDVKVIVAVEQPGNLGKEALRRGEGTGRSGQ